MPCMILKYEYESNYIEYSAFAVLDEMETEFFIEHKHLFDKISIRKPCCNGYDSERATAKLLDALEIEDKDYSKFKGFMNKYIYIC